MSSSSRQPSRLEKSATASLDVSRPRLEAESHPVRAATTLAAFSFEFVAKPEQAAGATLDLPAAIQSGLQDVAGFAGSLVMVSDQEARLITVVVFWDGSEARRSGAQVARRVRALLAPYMDRCLRVQNLLAHLPVAPDLDSQPSSIDTRCLTDESIAQEANVCVA